MKKLCILIVFIASLSINMKAQNEIPYLKAKLQSFKTLTGQNNQLCTLETGVDTINVMFGIDSKETINRYWVETDFKKRVYIQHFNLDQKKDTDDFYIKNVDIIFDKDTKKISFEMLYSPTLNEVRYIWVNNNRRSQTASIVNIDNLLQINHPLPNLSFKLLNGKTISSKDFEGKCIVLNWWFTGCSPCREEIPGLNRLVNKYRNNKDIVFVAISSDRKGTLEKYLINNEFNYIQTLTNIEMDKIFGNSFPKNIIVSPNGIITYYSAGYTVNAEIEIGNEIERLITKK